MFTKQGARGGSGERFAEVGQAHLPDNAGRGGLDGALNRIVT